MHDIAPLTRHRGRSQDIPHFHRETLEALFAFAAAVHRAAVQQVYDGLAEICNPGTKPPRTT